MSSKAPWSLRAVSFYPSVFQPPSPPGGSPIEGGPGQACHGHRLASAFPPLQPHGAAAGDSTPPVAVFEAVYVSKNKAVPPPQVLSCLLQEQRLVFFSADWARLTLVAESLLVCLQVSQPGGSEE